MASLPPVKSFSDEWFLLNYLEPWTASDIKLAIAKNVRLQNLFFDYPSQTAIVKTTLLNYDAAKANTGNVLFYLSQRRPDLYNAIVQTDGGLKWLSWNIEDMRGLWR